MWLKIVFNLDPLFVMVVGGPIILYEIVLDGERISDDITLNFNSAWCVTKRDIRSIDARYLTTLTKHAVIHRIRFRITHTVLAYDPSRLPSYLTSSLGFLNGSGGVMLQLFTFHFYFSHSVYL